MQCPVCKYTWMASCPCCSEIFCPDCGMNEDEAEQWLEENGGEEDA